MNSSLGKYAPLTAAVTGVGIVGAYIVGILLSLPGADALQPMALLAVGAIFGSAVVANGVKEPLRQAAVANARLDAIDAPHVQLATPAEITTRKVVAAELDARVVDAADNPPPVTPDP